jgi:hypothetical protein
MSGKLPDCMMPDGAEPCSAFTEQYEEAKRLRKLVQYCRMRLKKDAYVAYVDKCLADLSILDPDPEMQGKLVQSSPEHIHEKLEATNQGES